MESRGCELSRWVVRHIISRFSLSLSIPEVSVSLVCSTSSRWDGVKKSLLLYPSVEYDMWDCLCVSIFGIWMNMVFICFHAGFQDADITDICIFETIFSIWVLSTYCLARIIAFLQTCWSKESGSTPELLCGVGSPIVVASVSFYGSFNYIIQYQYNIYYNYKMYMYIIIYIYTHILLIKINQCTYMYTTIFANILYKHI